MRTVSAWGVAVLLLLSLLLEAHGKDPCSKDWLRYMVVNACGMDKRHLRGKPTVSQAVKEILNEVDTEFDNWVNGGGFFDEEDDDELDKLDNRVPVASRNASRAGPAEFDANDKAPEPAASSFIIRLFQHPGQALADAWMGLMGMEPKRKPQRRAAVQNLISRCCSEDCSEDAFEGVCD